MRVLQPSLQLVLHDLTHRRKALATALDQLLTAALVCFDGRAETGALEVHVAVGGLIADEGFVAGQVHELTGLELLTELAVQVFGVVEADTEGDECADVAKDGLPHGGGELCDVLMAQGEIEPVFARLGEDSGEGLGGEVLEFIDK